MKIIYSLLLSCFIFPCRAQHTISRDTLPGEVITIPVVIHILYNTTVQNISDAQALSQIESLNKDYRRLNDIKNIPSAFSSLSADAKIVFCVAKTDPQGKPTTGIIHKYTKTGSWSADDGMKFSSSAGDDGWDSKQYLNLWVCNLTGSNLGYASVPGSIADKDGVVIQYDVFGTTGNLRKPFDKGRTATHEIGHWLGLLHLWGDVLCGDDKIDDTPPQKSYNNGSPAFPHMSTCSINANGDMFMNFMDFTDDAAMNMFTHGQVRKMRSLFALGKVRNSFLSTGVCNSPSPQASPTPADTTVMAGIPVQHAAATTISLYPNPAKNFINVEAKNGNELIGKTLVIYDILGAEVKRQSLISAKSTILINDILPGVYVVRIGAGKEMKILRLVKQ